MAVYGIAGKRWDDLSKEERTAFLQEQSDQWTAALNRKHEDELRAMEPLAQRVAEIVFEKIKGLLK